MGKYLLKFNGRKVGAIGVFGDFKLIVNADNEKEAILKAYDTHEHLTRLTVSPMKEHKDMIDKMQAERKTICEYCGKEKEGLSFMIGASRAPAWVMVEGTGKMSCPDCWADAMAEGRAAINKHIADYNVSIKNV